jgi:hypothetical protein
MTRLAVNSGHEQPNLSPQFMVQLTAATTDPYASRSGFFFVGICDWN